MNVRFALKNMSVMSTSFAIIFLIVPLSNQAFQLPSISLPIDDRLIECQKRDDLSQRT